MYRITKILYIDKYGQPIPDHNRVHYLGLYTSLEDAQKSLKSLQEVTTGRYSLLIDRFDRNPGIWETIEKHDNEERHEH